MAMDDPSRDHDADSASLRPRLRQEKIAARLAMPATDHARASAAIEARLQSVVAARRPGLIAFCWPLRQEFDCRGFVIRLLAEGWRACQPVVVRRDAPMAFRAWTPQAPMTTDRHGIPIPDTAACETPDVILLPLVAFDAAGYRIGYGGGYFDRTLAALEPRPLAIGVGFELALVASTRPGPHDIRLDAIVTEAGTWTI
jgi:5,10-methenyltetrahydrofolate synthetase